MERDPGSRRVLCVALALAALWGAWALSYETTGFPGLNYVAFGFVSLPIGGGLFVAGVVAFVRARSRSRRTSDAVAAILVSAALAVAPLVALFEVADYS
jgi:hypothetical protein